MQIALPDADKRNGYDLTCEIVATVPQAHGVYDINCIQWRHPQSPVASQAKSTGANGHWRPPSGNTMKQETDSMLEDAKPVGNSSDAEGVAMLATAADDGTVKIWRLQKAGHKLEDARMT